MPAHSPLHSVPVEHAASTDPLPTIWRVDDALWARIGPIIDELDPPAPTGRKRGPARPIFDALIYRGRTGTQWNQLPTTFPNGDPFPDDSTVHRRMQHWIERGIFERIWALLIDECDELGGVSFDWQAVDTALGKLAAAVMKWGAIPPIAGKTA